MHLKSLIGLVVVAASLSLGHGEPPPTQQAKPIDVPIRDCGTNGRFRLIGDCGLPFGEIGRFRGTIVDGASKGWNGGLNLAVTHVNGKPLSSVVQLPVRPWFGDWEQANTTGTRLSTPAIGKEYEFEGYESGGFVGHSSAVLDRTGVLIQTSTHVFHTELLVFNQVSPALKATYPAK